MSAKLRVEWLMWAPPPKQAPFHVPAIKSLLLLSVLYSHISTRASSEFLAPSTWGASEGAGSRRQPAESLVVAAASSFLLWWIVHVNR